MNKYLFDTNILVDAVVPVRPGYTAACTLLAACRDAGCEVYVTSSSLKDAYYLICRHYSDEPKARAAVRKFATTFRIIDLTAAIIDRALDSSEPDFEDGIVMVAAEEAGCERIVTRDEAAFRAFRGRKLTAAQAVSELESDA